MQINSLLTVSVYCLEEFRIFISESSFESTPRRKDIVLCIPDWPSCTCSFWWICMRQDPSRTLILRAAMSREVCIYRWSWSSPSRLVMAMSAPDPSHVRPAIFLVVRAASGLQLSVGSDGHDSSSETVCSAPYRCPLRCLFCRKSGCWTSRWCA